ncbi:hypothetical protein AALP_AA6G067400 [Arabis alpina]|uniref:Uncharacterized protein n=1 Tax=Arabis alpina TaxID=50452 RepID=A0A087GMJ2_ARAAL|nr:hypothetical protein AALP_AA6G067400 [Arabis alpina]
MYLSVYSLFPLREKEIANFLERIAQPLISEMLRPIPNHSRLFKNLELPSLPTTPGGNDVTHRDSDCVTPPQGRIDSSFDDLQATRRLNNDQNEGVEEDSSNNENGQVDRRLSWPPSVKKSSF